MPTYSFECTKCENGFDESLRMAEMDLPLARPCPECGEENSLKRVINRAPQAIACDPFKSLSSDHRYALKQMKKRHPKSNIKDY